MKILIAVLVLSFGINNANACADTGCLNDGICIDGLFCVCFPGHTGDLCETEWNPCSSGPCLNGGICETNGDSIYCTCQQD